MSRRGIFLLLFALAIAAAWFFLVRPVRVDPDVVASAELAMWQSYYDEDKTRLAWLLVDFLRKNFGLSALEAKQAGEQFAAAALQFRKTWHRYDERVLPELEKAYTTVREAGNHNFDPAAVARAELAWWVARRTPGQNSVEQVGAKIGELYSVLYGSAHPAFQEAGLLRAEAAHLRDTGGPDADWDKIGVLLRESYRAMAKVEK